MPRINISEYENQVLKLGNNITDTWVLVPLVLKSGNTDVTPKSYLAGTTSKFTADFSSKVLEETIDSANVKERSYDYICKLLDLGLNVIVKPVIHTGSTAVTETVLTTFINTQISESSYDVFGAFTDKSYNIKFITTGAHANMTYADSALGGCYSKLATLASSRGDAIALLELESDVTCDGVTGSGIKEISTVLTGAGEAGDSYKFAACFYPWCSIGTSTSSIELPASFAYLSAFANSIQTNSDWYAASGVDRGVIPNLVAPKYLVSEAKAAVMLGDNGNYKFIVNPIKPAFTYGYRVWGNKVAAVFGSSSDSFFRFLNVRVLLCDLKKQVYSAATRVTFEPNDMITWLNFQNLANELLDDMQANRGIEWYAWRRQATTEKATIKAILTIKPIEAVEYFEIAVELTSEDASVTE